MWSASYPTGRSLPKGNGTIRIWTSGLWWQGEARLHYMDGEKWGAEERGFAVSAEAQEAPGGLHQFPVHLAGHTCGSADPAVGGAGVWNTSVRWVPPKREFFIRKDSFFCAVHWA